MNLLIAFMVGILAGFGFSGKLRAALIERKRLAYKQALVGLQEARELHAAAILRHVIASEMQAERPPNAP